MTKASKNRVARKANAVEASKIVPESIIKFTQLPNGGFTFALGLHGARMEALLPDTSHDKSIVDVMALAVSYLLKNYDPALVKAVAHADAVLNLTNKLIGEGLSPQEVMAEVARLDEEAKMTPAPAEAVS